MASDSDCALRQGKNQTQQNQPQQVRVLAR